MKRLFSGLLFSSLLFSGLLFSCFLSATTVAKIHTELTTHQADIAAINTIVEKFKLSISSKNKTLFLSIIHSETIPWIGIFSDTSLKFVKNINPKATKVTSSSHLEFIDWIVSQEEKLEEKFWNLKIHSEGNIASVHFDYSFHKGSINQTGGKRHGTW